MTQDSRRPVQMSDGLLSRIRGEFREMPGLRLTFAQARRLWRLDSDVCKASLQSLVDEGFLGRTTDGAFIARSPITHTAAGALSRLIAKPFDGIMLRPARDRRRQSAAAWTPAERRRSAATG